MDWHDLKLVGTIMVASLLAAALSTAKTWTARLIAVGVGAFSAVIFTEPVIHWLGLEFTVWQYAVSGLLAMSGDRIVRRAFRIIEDGELPGRK